MPLKPRGQDRQHHAADAGEHAAAGRLRVVHPVQREDEQRRGHEIRKLDEDFHQRFPPAPGVLNILSMRSVIRKPLTMLVIEANSATAPSKRIGNRIRPSR